MSDEWKQEQDDLAVVIADIANGNQLADDFSTTELKNILNSSAASEFVRQECSEALKSRKH